MIAGLRTGVSAADSTNTRELRDAVGDQRLESAHPRDIPRLRSCSFETESTSSPKAPGEALVDDDYAATALAA